MGYDAFVSYSHAGDDLLAERVQDGLQRLAKPWWRRRALSVFRDRTGLSANPGLWSSIAEAIDDSRYFLLLASPEAAASPWVAREVAQWRAKHGSDNLLVLLTDGDIVWDNEARDFDWQRTTALGAVAFAGCFAEEPRHVDMRWARSEVQLDLTDGRFRDQIAELAAPVHGMAKDELAGADVRQHRRTLRHALFAGVALAFLTLASIATSAYAVNSAASARRSAARARSEQHRADEQATLAAQRGREAQDAATLAAQRGREAQDAKVIADRRRKEAEQSSTAAKKSAHEAELERASAQLSADQAQLQRAAAQVSADKARLSADEAEVQRAAAVVSADQARVQRAAALVSKDEAQRQQLLAEARRNDLAAANVKLKQTNDSLVDQQHATEYQRLAGVARQLALGSKAALADGVTDRALLLAAQSVSFAAQSHGRIAASELQPSLVDALQRNPKLIGWLRGLDGPIADVDADSTHAAAMSTLGRVGVWRLADRHLVATFAAPAHADRIRFLGPDTLIVTGTGTGTGTGSVDAFRTTTVGSSWAHVWTHTTPGAITALATGANRLLVSSALPAIDPFAPPPSVIETLDAANTTLGTVTVADAVQRVALAPDNITFATAGVNVTFDATGDHFHLVVHVYKTSDTPPSSFDLDVTPVPSATPPPWSSFFFPGVMDLRFSIDGTKLAALGSFPDAPAHGWDLNTRHETFSPPSFGWSTVVPGIPIGLSADWNAIVSRDNTNNDVIGVGYRAEPGTFTGNLDAPVAKTGIYTGGAVDGYRLPAFTPDGQQFLTSAGDSTIAVFELPDSPHSHFARTRTIPQPDGANRIAAFSPDGRLLATTAAPLDYFGNPTGHNILRITTLDGSRSPLDIPLGHEPQPASDTDRDPLMFGDRGDEVAIALTDGSIDVYETTTGTRRLHLPPHICHHSVYCFPSVAFSGSLADGRIAEADDAALWIWDLRSGKVIASHVMNFPGADGTTEAKLSASGSRAVILSFVVRDLFDVKATAHVFDATAHGWAAHASFPVISGAAVALSPDGRTLVIADGAKVSSYEADHGRVMWEVPGDDQGAWFASDGTLYTASQIGVVRIRSTETGTIRLTLNPTSSNSIFGSAAAAALFATPTHVIAAGFEFTFGSDGQFVVTVVVTDWPLATTDLVAAACNEAGRNLTLEEWKQYVGTFDAYEKTCPGLP